jgi:hypothetical protein
LSTVAIQAPRNSRCGGGGMAWDALSGVATDWADGLARSNNPLKRSALIFTIIPELA